MNKLSKKTVTYVYDTFSIDLDYELKDQEYSDFDDITEILQDSGAFNQDVIYYATAMEYLSENDSSLKESLELAHDMGYTAENINSELLASLLKTKNCNEEWEDMREDINNELE